MVDGDKKEIVGEKKSKAKVRNRWLALGLEDSAVDKDEKVTVGEKKN